MAWIEATGTDITDTVPTSVTDTVDMVDITEGMMPFEQFHIKNLD